MICNSLVATHPADEEKVSNAKAKLIGVIRACLITFVFKSEKVKIYFKDMD